MHRFETIIGLIRDLVDDNTLVLIGVIVIALTSPEHREIVIGGLLGWLTSKKTNPSP